MKLINRNFLAVYIFLNCCGLSAQSGGIFEKDITAGDHRIFLTNNESNFFTGSIQIADKYNNTVFYADSIFSRYNWDTLIDLNNDGIEELIIDFGTGALMYDYNMFLIFDFTKNAIEPFEIHNADLIINIDETPKIVSNVRLSPAVLGAGYSFSVKYENGRLITENNMNESKVLKSLDIGDEEDLYMLGEYSKQNDECDDESQLIVYYEAYLMQKMILGQAEKGWEFFEKNYNCSNKNKIRTQLENTVKESYGYLINSDFKFNEERYY